MDAKGSVTYQTAFRPAWRDLTRGAVRIRRFGNLTMHLVFRLLALPPESDRLEVYVAAGEKSRMPPVFARSWQSIYIALALVDGK